MHIVYVYNAQIHVCKKESLFRKGIKMKIFFTFYNNLCKDLHKCCEDNFALTIMCQPTFGEIQIPLGTSFNNFQVSRQVLKAKTIILCSVHSMYLVNYVFSTKICIE